MDADSPSNKRLKMTAVVPDSLVQRLHEKQQEHVLKFYNDGKLTAVETGTLVKQLEALDLDLLDSIFRASTAGEANTANKTANIEPLDEFDLLENCSEDDKQRWLSLGLEAISKGQMCALMMGGGQGTRLGFAGPKGMYNIGLPSERSLFQLFTERVLKLQRLAAATFPNSKNQGRIQLFVMTSVMNHDETVAYFRDHAYFGLDEQQMFFFPQGTLPCFTRDGKLMLENAHTLAAASDGNGGIYKALAQSGGLARLQQHGVKYLHVFSVDNALCKAADPVFIGYCIAKNADCGNKVVWKSRASESVGVVAKKDGKFCVVEYSEMNKAASELTDALTGKLAFGAANICNHFFTTEFLSDVALPNMSLEYHVAEKKIPIAGDDGVTYTPTTNSGIKLEAFIFDTFPLSSRMAVLAVPRETEFAPVKNAPGSALDSPDTARQMIYDESKAWLLAAGEATLSKEEVEQLRSQKLDAARAIDISPLVSFNGEGLESHLKSLCDGSSQAVIRVESPETPATRLSIPATIRQRFEDAHQGHLFHFVDQGQVSAHEASVLVESIRDIDPASLNNLFQRSTSADAQSQSRPDEIEPLEDGVVDILAMASADTKSQWLARGLDAVAKGMVAALVLAGGQGTRLGFSGPKGMYDIGLPSHKTLFEIFADRIRKVQQLAQDGSGLQDTPRVPFLIMTSEMNHDDTASYFMANSYFGLDANQVHFFRQGTLPCFTMDGKIILETPSTVSRASDGNGGIYPALQRSGMLRHLETTNVQYLHVFSVDNVLCKVADPVFIGYCIANDADCANKVVWKSRPSESVGVFAKKNGAFCVVEYSELDTPSSELVDAGTGKLVFGAANICNHFYRLDFLKRCCDLEDFAAYHVAKKKIPFVDETTGSTIVPTTNSGIKLETFIFDVFQHATNMKVLGVEREDEFAPVKNAPGSATDSPDTARHLVSEQCKRWLLKAGATFDDGSNGLCEVVASVSYDGEGLEQIATTRSPIKLPALIK